MTNPNRSVNIGTMIPRLIHDRVLSSLKVNKKVHLLFGARQVGKTTLLFDIRKHFESKGLKTLYLNADLDESRSQIDSTSLTVLEKLILGIDVIFLDEAQRLSDPGLTLKIIHDHLPGIKILATGSSSFDLKNQTAETLTGRYMDFALFPLSMREVERDTIKFSFLLPTILTFGLYPEIYLTNSDQDKKLKLGKIIESYLFKDVLSFNRIRNSRALVDLTRALAYQIGSEVNENELSNRLKIDRKTVLSYLEVLEKSFVIFRLYPFSRRPRREIGKNYKVYFVDLGIRNALIGDFNPVMLRADFGSMWENFLISERMKRNANSGRYVQNYFWRNYGGAEVDYLELFDGKIEAFEIKAGEGKLSKGAGSFRKKYGVDIHLINKNNFSEFI